MSHCKIKPQGFTLIELLVVIAIISVLIALALAGRAIGPRGCPPHPVRQQPEADRPALHNYEETTQALPFGKGGDYMSVIPGAPVYARWSTHSQLLAFLEQRPLYDAINFNLPPETPDARRAWAWAWGC